MSILTPSRILHGDCVQVMRELPSESVDFILTDPPYLVRYRDRGGRTVANDDNDRWLKPAFAEMFRLLKPGTLALSFYGWNAVDRFFDAWKTAGFRVVGHLVFRKRYASSTRFFEYRHESAYLLAKGDVTPPAAPLPDVLDWEYTGNRLHPTEKPVQCLTPIVRSFCKPGGLVLDSFCGSGSSLVAARDAGCAYLGIELDAGHHRTASERLHGVFLDQADNRHVDSPASVVSLRSRRRSIGEAGWPRPFTRYVDAIA
jgi:site-specific DNA-methyltransferase (adenine-specific)